MTTTDPTKLADELAWLAIHYQRNPRAGDELAMLVSNNAYTIIEALRRPTPPPDVAKLSMVLEAARLFIENEYRDPSCEADGEWLAKEARPIHDAICGAHRLLSQTRRSWRMS
jgi:hypothetical protein